MQLRKILFAPAKINLGLKITGRYANGYHRLETIFVPITLFDRLSVRVSDRDAVFHSWPADVSPPERGALALGALKNPLLWKTIAMVRGKLQSEAAHTLPYLAVTVQKNIPSPAGLGGASADAAALIGALWQQGGKAQPMPFGLIEQSEKLGADIPFFLRHGLEGRSAFLRGIGHELIPVALPRLAGWICVPDFGFPTGQMFAEVRRWALPETTADSAQNDGTSKPKLALRLNEIPYSDEPFRGIRVLQNDFDTAAQTVFPGESRLLSEAKVQLAGTAAQFFPGEWVLGMTGSGAGLFAATTLKIPLQRLNALKPLLQTRLGPGWKVFAFRSLAENIGP